MKRFAATAALCALLLALSSSVALSADYATGDLATDVPNVASPQELADAHAYATWAAAPKPEGLDAPHAYLSTKYCPQLRSYWCGPAAVQTALTYFGSPPSQGTIATRLGTTSGGTSMSKVDDVLRYFTARTYSYHTITSVGDFNGHVEYTIGSKRQPMVVDVRIIAPWGPYRYDHAGHILCVDGFNWTPCTIRVNDSYDEHTWQGAGGHTGGPGNYDRGTLFNGVWRHAGHPIVY